MKLGRSFDQIILMDLMKMRDSFSSCISKAAEPDVREVTTHLTWSSVYVSVKLMWVGIIIDVSDANR